MPKFLDVWSVQDKLIMSKLTQKFLFQFLINCHDIQNQYKIYLSPYVYVFMYFINSYFISFIIQYHISFYPIYIKKNVQVNETTLKIFDQNQR